MMLALIGLVAGVLAFFLGRWRHLCRRWEQHKRWNVPRAWRSAPFRMGTLIVVAALTLLFATCFSVLISEHVHDFLGKFAWGALIWLRWMASSVSAEFQFARQKKEVEEMLKPKPGDLPPLHERLLSRSCRDLPSDAQPPEKKG